MRKYTLVLLILLIINIPLNLIFPPSLSTSINIQQQSSGSQNITSTFSLPSSNVAIEDTSRVVIEVKIEDMDAILKLINSMEANVESIHNNMIQININPVLLDELSQNSSILCIRSILIPIINEITSEGVESIKADFVHSQGFTGENINIAVIDAGFYPTNTEISNNIKETKSFRVDADIQGGIEASANHGTACTEIVVDVAPNAQLYLINFETDIEYLIAVDYAISKGVDIITCSIGFVNVGPFDGTSYIAEAAEKAAQAGILFITSAGNSAQSHWKGIFNDNDEDSYHNYSFDDETNDIILEKNKPVKIFLSWNDWPTSNQDYDLYLFDSTLNLVAFSNTPQVGIQPPTESIVYFPPSTNIYRIVIIKSSASETHTFHLFCFSAELEHYTEEGSLTSPADAKSAMSVGAVSFVDNLVKPYSSQGPTDDGRIKPDIMAPDGVSTSTYGSTAFHGTSAAAPHIAGVAALLLNANRSLTLEDLHKSLETTTIDKGQPGKDNVYGMGIVNAHDALHRVYATYEKFSVSVHSLPDTHQYPDLPSQELSIQITIIFVEEGKQIIKNMTTPFNIQADKGSIATLTVLSVPFSYAWHEWDDYGFGRTSSRNIELILNEDHIAIAYFSKMDTSGSSILEIHAHPVEIVYPNEPERELPLTLKVNYTWNQTTYTNEVVTIETTPVQLFVEPNSTSVITVVLLPEGYTWVGWETESDTSTSNHTLTITTQNKTKTILIAYLKPIDRSIGNIELKVEPELIIFIPGQTAYFTIHIQPLNGFDDEILLKVTAPPEVNIILTPERLTPPNTATLMVITDKRISYDQILILIEGVYHNSTAQTLITLQAWTVPGYSIPTLLVGLFIASTILYWKKNS